ncbi:jg19368 [Pararge aegeria aegeria]|uniref:Jg19368 protein n=1 Tax=Pararge aegeria aegeria TaxID=348720 RepID=A0A8S4R6K5_9NEOP|nr:jg19368 [Pararge aegeria aegeria]
MGNSQALMMFFLAVEASDILLAAKKSKMCVLGFEVGPPNVKTKSYPLGYHCFIPDILSKSLAIRQPNCIPFEVHVYLSSVPFRENLSQTDFCVPTKYDCSTLYVMSDQYLQWNN